MSKVLFILFNGSGRILPAIGTIRALRRQGHAVGLVTVPGEFVPREHLVPQMEALGVTLFPSPEPPAECHPGTIYPGTSAREMFEYAQQGGAEASLSIRRQRQIVPVLPQIDPLRAIISRYEPDLVVADTLAYQAGIAAHLEGRPYVGYSASLRMVAPPTLGMDVEAQPLIPEAQAIFARFGMEPKFASLEYLSPLLNLVYALPEFVGNDYPNAELLRLVGPPAVDARGDDVPFPWERLATDRPLVFVSCGSVLRWRPDLIDALVAATEPLGVQCIATAGELAQRPYPPHVLAVSYAPQIQLLQRVRALATVGGANTMNEALCAGVPILVTPILSDQFVQGHFVTSSGVGICLRPEERTVERLRDAFARLLDDSRGFKARVQAVQRVYARADGARGAAEAIVSALPRP